MVTQPRSLLLGINMPVAYSRHRISDEVETCSAHAVVAGEYTQLSTCGGVAVVDTEGHGRSTVKRRPRKRRPASKRTYPLIFTPIAQQKVPAARRAPRSQTYRHSRSTRRIPAPSSCWHRGLNELEVRRQRWKTGRSPVMCASIRLCATSSVRREKSASGAQAFSTREVSTCAVRGAHWRPALVRGRKSRLCVVEQAPLVPRAGSR